MTPFLAGLKLNRRFYHEVVRPILAAHFPSLPYSAALIGYGSDVLGYDTARSIDHEWGPRLLLFLRDEDSPLVALDIDAVLRRSLPHMFMGYPTNFTPHNEDDGCVRHLEVASGGEVNHHIQILTIRDFLLGELGVTLDEPLTPLDWLAFPEQKLLEVTAGAVYHDGLQRLEAVRQELSYYPYDVWLYRMSAQWQRIAQEEAFVGRAFEAGDALGARLIAGRLVRDLMRLCLLLERTYAPYSKWLGTAFSHLDCAAFLEPQFSAILCSGESQEVQTHLGQAYEYIAHRQNQLGVMEAEDTAPRYYFDRPYTVIRAERFARALAAAVRNEELCSLIENLGSIGAIDQWADSTDILTKPALCRRLCQIYHLA